MEFKHASVFTTGTIDNEYKEYRNLMDGRLAGWNILMK